MAKRIQQYIKLQIPAGNAQPTPPVGPALGQHGVNIKEFCDAFNGQTKSFERDMPIPVVISVMPTAVSVSSLKRHLLRY